MSSSAHTLVDLACNCRLDSMNQETSHQHLVHNTLMLELFNPDPPFLPLHVDLLLFGPDE